MFRPRFLVTDPETVEDVIADAKVIWPDDRTFVREIEWSRDHYLGYTLHDLLKLRIDWQRRMEAANNGRRHPGSALATWIAWRAYRAERRNLIHPPRQM